MPSQTSSSRLYQVYRGGVENQLKVQVLEVIKYSEQEPSRVLCGYPGSETASWYFRSNLYETFEEAKSAMIKTQYYEIREIAEKFCKKLLSEIEELDRLIGCESTE